MMNLESVSLKSALPGTNLVAPFFVISNVLRTAKPLFFIISNAPGPCAGRRFGPLLGRGGGRGAKSSHFVKSRKISRPLDVTVHYFSLIQDGKSVPWIHSKCGRHVAWSWRWGVTSGASQNTPPRTPNFGRISEEFRKRFPTYCVALRCVCVCAA